MSLKKQIQRNTEKRNRDTLRQYDSFLKQNWQSRPAEDINILAGFARNGITLNDLAREVDRARKQAFADTATAVQQVVYASVAVVLKEKFNFSKEQCFDAISSVDRKIATLIDNEEIIEEMRQIGIVFDSADGIERVRML